MKKYIGTLADLIDHGKIESPVAIYKNIHPVTTVIIRFCTDVQTIEHTKLAGLFATVFAEDELYLDSVVVNGGNTENNPVFSLLVKHVMDRLQTRNFVYHYNYPLLNDLVSVIDNLQVFYHPHFLKDPISLRELERLEKKGAKLNEGENIREKNVIYLPDEYVTRPYPVRKVVYHFDEKPVELKDVVNRKVLNESIFSFFGEYLASDREIN